MEGITALLEQAVRAGASDLHLAPGQPPWLRIEGRLAPLPAPALSAAGLSALLQALLDAGQRRALAARGELALSAQLPGAGRFRATLFAQAGGMGAAMRLLPDMPPTLAQLHCPAELAGLALRRHGLVVVAGSTGAGKSSTLAALVDHANRHRPGRILTLEDPIEFLHASHRCLVSQRQVGRDVPDLAQGLRSALRADPDVIVFGELRSQDEAQAALQAAASGHLVLTTLHAGSAVGAVERLLDLFPAGARAPLCSRLAEALQAVVGQRLLPRVGGGRVAVREVLIATAAVRNLIREDRLAQLGSALQTGRQQGMLDAAQDLERLRGAGLVAAAAEGQAAGEAFHVQPFGV